MFRPMGRNRAIPSSENETNLGSTVIQPCRSKTAQGEVRAARQQFAKHWHRIRSSEPQRRLRTESEQGSLGVKRREV